MGRDTHLRKSLGTLHSRIKEARVLMVGAGGIGCELLKNLVLTGFHEIHIVDLDTIDLSNLNRQFLFGMQHIKKSKAIVAKETAGKFNPNVKIEAHHANIKDPQFNVKWFKSFDLVFNALDNLDARKHVNRMCLAADVPLIESGTTGYHGQVQIIKQGETECYDCNPKPVAKSFPVCTIRSTPSQPIHCIVWAKSYLLAEVFGTSEESSPELDPTEDSENAKEIANLKREAEELKTIREKMDQPDFAESVFQKVYKADIDRLRSMEEMWKFRTKPEPLEYSSLVESSRKISATVAKADQKAWSLAENYVVFADSLRRLAIRLLEMKAATKEGDAPPIITFDKDDEDTLDFVAAAANLRSSIFGIDLKSKFDIKQMAGNIIPAIATTNAITAGLCVLQAFKVLSNRLSQGRMIFLAKNADRVFSAEKLAPPKKECQTCNVARCTVEADISKATLGDLVEKVLREGLGYGEELSILTGQLLYDVDFDDNLEVPLKELGFTEETFVTVVDDTEEEEDDESTPRVNLVIAVTSSERPEDSPISIPEPFDIPRKPKPPKAPANGETNGDEPMPLETNGTTNGTTQPVAGVKRTIDVELEEVSKNGAQPTKRIRLDDDLAVIEDRGVQKGKGKEKEMDKAVVKENGKENGNGNGNGNGVVEIEDDGFITID